MKNMFIVGRKKEIELLNEKLISDKPEFVALYGRRRIGKTYLVRNVFEGKFTFKLTGMAQVTLQEQLVNFNMAMQEQYPQAGYKNAHSWMEAFQQIKQVIEKSKQKKKVASTKATIWLLVSELANTPMATNAPARANNPI